MLLQLHYDSFTLEFQTDISSHKMKQAEMEMVSSLHQEREKLINKHKSKATSDALAQLNFFVNSIGNTHAVLKHKRFCVMFYE